jgi:uncharacterized protein YlxP (DUF503 family)
MNLGVLTLHLHLNGCRSLKEKRGRLKPLLARLRREFNISVAEIDHQDIWQDTLIACALVSSDHVQVERSLQQVARWVEANWPDVSLIDDHLEFFN